MTVGFSTFVSLTRELCGSVADSVHSVKNNLCAGRTNVKSDNAYFSEVAPMAERSPLVYHAILSLSATYILDFESSSHLEERAHYHHTNALQLLETELIKPEIYDPGGESAAIAALLLLSHNEAR
jgi:hypothetical protein